MTKTGASVLTLGVETSGLIGAVALRRDGATVETVTLDQIGRRHAQTLISEVASLLKRHDVTAKQLDAVAVGIGPGSFTGLRVGIVFAKTLAYATGCRLVSVDTFQAIAANSPLDVTDVFVIGDAQRGDLFVGHYVRDPQQTASTIGWNRLGELSIERADAWCQELPSDTSSPSHTAVSGPAAESLQPRLQNHVRVLSPEFHHPRADVTAALGEAFAQSQQFADLWTLEPYYLRRSAAEEKADSRPLPPASHSAT